MKTPILGLTLLTLVIQTMLTSCGKDVDAEAPSYDIELRSHQVAADTVCGVLEPNVIRYMEGDTLRFLLRANDEGGLSSYKIDLHQNFDCHGHGEGAAPGVSIPITTSSTQDWTHIIVNEVEGTELEQLIEIQSPENVTAGNYHFSIKVLDQAGNEAENQIFYTLKVQNNRDTVAPTLTSTLSSGQRSYRRGEEIVIDGRISDDHSLASGGNGLVFLSYIDVASGNSFATNAFLVLANVTTESSHDYQLRFTIPPFLRPGNFRFIVSGFDGVRNQSKPISYTLQIE